MHGSLDKLTPGWPAKAHLAFDLVVLCGAGAAALDPAALAGAAPLSLALAGVASWVVGAAVLRLYSPATPRARGDELALTVLLVVGVSAVLAAWERTALPDPHRFGVVAFCVSAILWTSTGRILVFQPLRSTAGPVEQVLVCGAGPSAVATARMLESRVGGRRHRVVGFLAFSGEVAHAALARGEPAPVLGNVDRLFDALAREPVDEVYIAGRALNHGAEIQRLVRACEQIGMPFALPVNPVRLERARLLSGPLSGPIAPDGYLHYISTDVRHAQYAIKRLVDIACSAAALAALAPLLIGVAVAIKLTSPGPVLYVQRRVGLHGAAFNLLKFRSMVVGAEAMQAALLAHNEQTGPVFKMRKDPRVTAVGRFIRKFSIDELPQLINILRGDMTIVGPRPALPSEVARYKLWQRRRLSMRPGLTCYWQVGGRDAIGFDEWMQLDLRYVDNWSLGEDLKLIAATIPVVLVGRGAS